MIEREHKIIIDALFKIRREAILIGCKIYLQFCGWVGQLYVPQLT